MDVKNKNKIKIHGWNVWPIT